jgi:hypothetical protein
MKFKNWFGNRNVIPAKAGIHLLPLMDARLREHGNLFVDPHEVGAGMTCTNLLRYLIVRHHKQRYV